MRSLLFLLTLALASMPALAADTVKLTVHGMVCGFCAQGIEKRLRALPQTADVYVNLSRKLVAVSLKDGQTLTDEQLTRELVDAGYAVRAIDRSQESLQQLKNAGGK